MIQLSQIPTSQPHVNELKTLLQFIMKKYGRYEYNVLKNLIVAAAFSSMINTYISFESFMKYITNHLPPQNNNTLIKNKQMPPSDLFNIKSLRLKLQGSNATCFGIKVETILFKTTQETYIETIEHFRNNIEHIKNVPPIYAAFAKRLFIK